MSMKIYYHKNTSFGFFNYNNTIYRKFQYIINSKFNILHAGLFTLQKAQHKKTEDLFHLKAILSI